MGASNRVGLGRIFPSGGRPLLIVKSPKLKLLLACLGLAALVHGPAAAQAPPKPVLTVYSYSGFTGKYGPGSKIKERFEAVCGCILDWVATENSGALLGRLKLEGAGSKADVALGLDVNIVAEARATGLFAEHGQPLAGLDMPQAWTDGVFLPFDWGHMAFIYDANKLKNPPTSLKELVENPNGPRIVLQDPRTSQPGLSLLLWMAHVHGDKANEAWAKLKPRIVTFTKGWSEAYGLFLKGEADMVLSYSTSPAYHVAVEKKDNFKAAAFSEGHYLYVETAAMLKASKQAELARQFLAFILSDAFQGAIPEGNWMFPVKTPAAGLPASFNGLIAPARSLAFTPDEAMARRRALIEGWQNAVGR
jgi:thiamine transport system substrate-binding protein